MTQQMQHRVATRIVLGRNMISLATGYYARGSANERTDMYRAARNTLAD
ncbi:Mycobacterium rhizamassiliense ORFan [Mycobacterium rhizamassiliense]|uniref:Mycobacterium rhizamassiliense ORFan n=1 Tax=Mycobacterium rhizamassiliense TaxID=1841860 RepID=A0A2U3NV00_9MYCO|nr:Mycobacterium rhizamassiliense ORFan [Mycobacterium rhizamassiliense]